MDWKTFWVFFAAMGVICLVLFFVDAFTPDITEIKPDTNVNIASSARLMVPTGFTIRSIDQQKVKWKVKWTATAFIVLLSPGSHTFSMDFSLSDGNYKWTSKGIEVETALQAGKFYQLKYYQDKAAKTISTSIEETEPIFYEPKTFEPRYMWLIAAAVCSVLGTIFYFWLGR